MARTKDRLYIRFRTAEGKQSPYCPALYDKKSRIRPGWCVVHGVEEHHPEGSYYQRVKNHGKWIWEALGKDPLKAKTVTVARKAFAGLWGKTESETQSPSSPPPRHLLKSEPEQPVADVYRLDDEIKVYLNNVAKLAPKTYRAYKLSLDMFRRSCRRTYMHQITKQNLQAFDSAMLADGYDDRTRHNRVEHIVTFLRNKEGRRLGPPITDVKIKVKYVERPPEAYTREELEALLAVSSEEEKALWRFFLFTGFRESEVAVAEATDINHDTKTIRVDEKPWFRFKPKDCEKRNVPISDPLIEWIDSQAKSGSCSLLFPTAYGKPNGHLLRRLKTVAFKGGLNCGKCMGTIDGKKISCAEAPVCEHWILHRFRKNFATDRHIAGAPARKIQKWLGHSDLETTLRYLAVGDDTTDEVRSIVNGVYDGL